ncbi:MAG: hypothetical protein U0Q22_03500 [Acidimicrobiales bacterium]
MTTHGANHGSVRELREFSDLGALEEASPKVVVQRAVVIHPRSEDRFAVHTGTVPEGEVSLSMDSRAVLSVGGRIMRTVRLSLLLFAACALLGACAPDSIPPGATTTTTEPPLTLATGVVHVESTATARTNWEVALDFGDNQRTTQGHTLPAESPDFRFQWLVGDLDPPVSGIVPPSATIAVQITTGLSALNGLPFTYTCPGGSPRQSTQLSPGLFTGTCNVFATGFEVLVRSP